jgi:hypothetical protein
MDEAAKAVWRSKEAWTLGEAAELLSGETSGEGLSRAHEALEDAAAVGILTAYRDPPPVPTNNSAIDNLRNCFARPKRFRSKEVIAWAADRFPKFTFQNTAETTDLEVNLLKARVAELEKLKAASEKPLATRERNTLLKIIAVLCKEAKLPCTTPSKSANLIMSAGDLMGISIGETTIEGVLKKIPHALETRAS